ncbi:MAG: hypothetical protein WDM85_00680 [Caulobacteraceae bacterium]
MEANADFDTGPFHHVLLLGAEFGHDNYANQAFTRTGSCNGVALAPASPAACPCSTRLTPPRRR